MRAFLATLAVVGLSTLVAACGQGPAEKKSEADKTDAPAATAQADAAAPAATAPSASAAACPDNAPRTKHTGLCQGEASALLAAAKPSKEGMPEGCDWVANDASFGDGSEAILYMAMRCEGRITQLEVRGGARSASIGYTASGFFKDIPADYEPVRVFPVQAGTDAKAMILELARQTTKNKKEAAGCEVRSGAADGYPADSFVVDVSAAYRQANKIAPLSTTEPDAESFCGQYGYASDGNRYWRIHGGFAWLHEFGQDVQDFDAASLVLMRKDAAGAWAPVK
ncbi:MAG TPA: hypothetical protein DCL54_04625 [Alphaproteobacteria bacterium]|nr:hypothetical protein [Alphaproteobacteria bacterium]HAJ45849.1 hypothetical protein [Alphaproteobacteria bacterium]